MSLLVELMKKEAAANPATLFVVSRRGFSGMRRARCVLQTTDKQQRRRARMAGARACRVCSLCSAAWLAVPTLPPRMLYTLRLPPHSPLPQVGSYHIGKERAYLGAAHQLGWQVHCTPSKRKVGCCGATAAAVVVAAAAACLRYATRAWLLCAGAAGPGALWVQCKYSSLCSRAHEVRRHPAPACPSLPAIFPSVLHVCLLQVLQLLGLPPEWLALLTANPREARVHVLGLGEQLHEQALADRIRGSPWERVVAIRPTGVRTFPCGLLAALRVQHSGVNLWRATHARLWACLAAAEPLKRPAAAGPHVCDTL